MTKKRWIKPVVGYAAVYPGNRLVPEIYSSMRLARGLHMGRVMRVVLVPYTVAQKAGLLRRPK
jgi:hypothetical protein